MSTPFRAAAALALLALALAAGPSAAQDVRPPEPLPMGVPYVYQPGNPYWYYPLWYYPWPHLYAYPSYYPFGATGNVYGRYSWDYNIYYTYGPAGYPNYIPAAPLWVNSGGVYYPPMQYYNYAWKGFAW
jgi:hypothetical protein